MHEATIKWVHRIAIALVLIPGLPILFFLWTGEVPPNWAFSVLYVGLAGSYCAQAFEGRMRGKGEHAGLLFFCSGFMVVIAALQVALPYIF